MRHVGIKLTSIFLLLGLMVMSACAFEASSHESEDSDQNVAEKPVPNVLIIIADDMGVDKMRTYGLTDDAANTPNLDAIAASGVVFENAWATPACSTTRVALLTGNH